MRTKPLAVLALAIFLFGSVLANAQNVTGNITNATTGKPAAGVEITLLALSQGMTEAGSTKSDAQGNFSLKLDGGQGPHLLRATYGGANYFKMVPPGVTTGNIEVYEPAKKLDGISGTVNVVRMQADSGTLQVMELYAVKNNSSPPRTLVGDNTFEVVLPEGAVIDQADAASPNGNPVTTMPSQTKQKNHYAFAFPLKPGESRFQIAYHLPYSGQATVSPKLTIPYDHFVVMVPNSMKLDLKNASLFQSLNEQPGANVQVTNTAVKPGQDVAFTVSGTGTIQDTQQDVQAQSGQGGTMGGGAQDNRPGGGLGRPIDSPDALAQYRWPMLGVLLVVLFGTSYLTLSRTSATPSAASEAEAVPVPSEPSVASRLVSESVAKPSNSAETLLAAMKEELFQLEIERQRGQISQKEYEEQKAALDQTLKRALARTAKNS